MAYVAIETKFLGATNYRGERVKAFIPDWSGETETAQYDYALSAFENHQKVAQTLADRFFNHYVKADGPITLVAGGIKRGYAWVRVSTNGVQHS
tara:strand:+ start:115 stop:396 length:282 start_codon:yes stop_codon:yes gene_type:complete